MNYRHAFHAGNFADLIKHSVLIELLRAMTAEPSPLTVIDTHAGAGVYDLKGPDARRTGEAEAGVVRLMADPDAPPALERLKSAVRKANRPDALRYYPGSPAIIAQHLRPQDRYIACEIRPDDYATLKSVLPRQVGAQVLKADGWIVAVERTPPAPERVLVLVDPPFEAPDDYDRCVEAARQVLRRNGSATLAIWAPLKDLATLDSFLGRLEDVAGVPGLVVEVRVRPLTDPMRMNGCAMVVLGPPVDLGLRALAAARWIAASGDGGDARIATF